MKKLLVRFELVDARRPVTGREFVTSLVELWESRRAEAPGAEEVSW